MHEIKNVHSKDNKCKCIRKQIRDLIIGKQISTFKIRPSAGNEEAAAEFQFAVLKTFCGSLFISFKETSLIEVSLKA